MSTDKTQEKSEKCLISMSNHLDPEVAKTAKHISDETKDNEALEVSTPKILKPVGKKIKPDDAAKSIQTTKQQLNHIQKMYAEAEDNGLMSEEIIHNVIEWANKNPITKELIEEAREKTIENVPSIRKQFNDLVALYNIKQDKAFFFVTSAEARLAIDYIKKCRNGYSKQKTDQELQDKLIHKLMKKIPSMNINDDANKIEEVTITKDNVSEFRFAGSGACLDTTATTDQLVRKYVENLIEFEERLYNIDAGIKNHREITAYDPMKKYVDDPFCNIFGNLDIDKRIEMLEKYEKDEITQTPPETDTGGIIPADVLNLTVKTVKTAKEEYEEFKTMIPPEQFKVFDYKAFDHEGQTMSLNQLNHAFSIIESADMTVDAILMNSNGIATVRNWGKMVYDEYSKEELRKRKTFGRIFTAEIYVCNRLKDNQVLVGSLNAKPYGVFVNMLLN